MGKLYLQVPCLPPSLSQPAAALLSARRARWLVRGAGRTRVPTVGAKRRRGPGGEGGEGEAHCLKKDSVDMVTFCPEQCLRWLKEPEVTNNKHSCIESLRIKEHKLDSPVILGQRAGNE